MLDLFCSLCQYCQYGSLYPANTKKGMIVEGIEAGGIYTYQPVSMGAGESGLVQGVIILAGLKVAETFGNSGIFHTADL